jgi:glycosyltransferase involved in cell wall biosynthesis
MNGVEGANGVPGVSGGDVRLIRILKLLSDRLAITLSTTVMGRKLAELYGLNCNFHIIKTSTASGIRANIARILASVLDTPPGRFDLAYSGGEHLYDVLPALRMKLFKRTPWLALVHWVEDYPWNDKRGGTPALHRYLYWINRVVAMGLIKMFADQILAVSESTREKLVSKRGFARDRVSAVFCGLDLPFALSVRNSGEPKIYDATFMKRLNLGKGVRDLIEIWALVVAQRPRSRLQIIGDGPPDVVAELGLRIRKLGLSDCIELVGVVHDPIDKARRLAQSKLFVLPSHEENWAIVIGEALAAGLPVIAYDLAEIRHLWQERVDWIPFADTKAFASRILQRLEAPATAPLDDFLRSLDWTEIGRNEYEQMQCLIRS